MGGDRAFQQEILRQGRGLLAKGWRQEVLLPLALLLSVTGTRDLPVGSCVELVGSLADRVARYAGPGASRQAAVEALNRVFFTEAGFGPHPGGTYVPAYSELFSVFERRVGIPISLGVIYLAVGWAAGWPMAGINFPGHFLVGWRDGEGLHPIDVHGGGCWLNEEGCRGRLKEIYGDDLPYSPSLLQEAGPRAILVRVLNNLKGHYMQTGALSRAGEVCERILLVDPRRYTEYRDRGLLSYQEGLLQEARADLLQYLHYQPQAPDAVMARAILAELEEEAPFRH